MGIPSGSIPTKGLGKGEDCQFGRITRCARFARTPGTWGARMLTERVADCLLIPHALIYLFLFSLVRHDQTAVYTCGWPSSSPLFGVMQQRTMVHADASMGREALLGAMGVAQLGREGKVGSTLNAIVQSSTHDF